MNSNQTILLDPVVTMDDFRVRMQRDGFALFERLVPDELLTRIREDVPRHEARCREWQLKGGLTTGMEGAAHHIVGGEDSLDEFLYRFYLDNFIRDHFGGEYILNSFGALNNRADAQSFYQHGHRFHRDVRTYSSHLPLMLNMLVMVDAFTVENGATKLVPGSHLSAERPADDEMEARSVRLTGPAGSIALFDSNLWHSAAPNVSGAPRIALTLTFTRPFFKQQMDYPRMLGETFPRNEKMRQLLGYNARVPANHGEWYQPPEKRMYKADQG